MSTETTLPWQELSLFNLFHLSILYLINRFIFQEIILKLIIIHTQ